MGPDDNKTQTAFNVTISGSRQMLLSDLTKEILLFCENVLEQGQGLKDLESCRYCEIYLLLLYFVLLLHPEHDLCHVGLQHHPSHHQLVEDELDGVHVEDQVQLTHVLEAFVKSLHKDLYQVQNAQLRLAAVHTEHKVEGGVMPVKNTRVTLRIN